MSPAQAQIEANLPVPEEQESSSLQNVIHLNRARQVRQEIGIIADRSWRDHLINDEAYSGYREVAENREQHQLSVEMLESTRKFARDHEEKAIRIHQKIMAARNAKIASETDENFLMEKLVAENIQFIQRSGEVETLIDQKLARMRDNKNAYNKLANHKLIKNIGYLKVNASTRIDFPKEEDFLKMTVPERKALLKKLEEALPKAEKYAEENSKAIDIRQVKDYQAKLKKAIDRRIIGDKTAKKFMDGFKKIDNEEREHWLAEFDKEMERYETLWKNIRGDLRGSALQHMENKINQLGYTELLTEFGNIKEQEKNRLVGEYKKDLGEYQKQGKIGEHTVTEFEEWIESDKRSMNDRYEAADKLPTEMQRYEKLWEEAETLKPKQRKYIKSKIDEWGYTELHHQLQAFKSGQDVPEETGISASERVLSNVRSAAVKQAIRQTDEMLDKQGGGKKNAFMGIVERVFRRQTKDKFDASSFERNLRRKTGRDEDKASGRGVKGEVSFSEVNKDIKNLQKSGTDVIAQDGFVQAETEKHGGKSHRDTMVQINRNDSMERLLSEDRKRTFKSETEGGNDDLSFTIKHDGQIMKLNLEETRITKDYMQEKEQEKMQELDEAV